MNNYCTNGKAPVGGTTEALSEVTQPIKEGFNVNNSIALTIGATSVREVGGLYSLNDLHKASGGEPKHRPGYFLEIEQTKDLTKEIETAGIPAVKTKEGRNGGTYACRELVIAYAAWISAAFHLKVIRVFLAVAVPQPTPYTVQPSDTLNESQQIALRAMLESNVKRLPQAKRAGAMIKGWSKLKAHFGVPYRQIPAGEFEEALSIIARHVSEWELVDEAPQQPQQDQEINVAALLLSGQCDPKPLTAAQHMLIDQCAGRLVGEAYPLIRAHLERRVAWSTNAAQQNSAEATQVILGGATLGNCLTHHYRNELQAAHTVMQVVRQRLDAALGSIIQPLGLSH